MLMCHYAGLMLRWSRSCSHTLSLPSWIVAGIKWPGPCGNQPSHTGMQALVPYETSGDVSFRNFCSHSASVHSMKLEDILFSYMEVSKQNVKTDWEWEESSNRSNDLTTFNIRCYFISHNLNMPTNCLASKVVTILLLLPHTIIQLLELFMFLLL